MRKDIHEKRSKMIENQIAAKKAFINNVIFVGAMILTAILCGFIIWGTIEIILSYGK